MARLKQANLAEETYSRLKHQIITLGFRPGQNLLEEELEIHLQASRTPIRMALCKLEKEGLVCHQPRRGFFVSDIRVHQVIALFQVREFLEVPAVRLSALRASEAEIRDLENFTAGLEQALARQDPEAYLSGGVEFHHRLAQLSGNEVLCDIVRGLNEKLSIVARILLRSERRLMESSREHQGIVESLLNREAEEAAERLRKHITDGGREFLRLLRSKTELLSISPPQD